MTLWRGHGAAPQQQLASSRRRNLGPCQRDVLLAMLRGARADRRPVELPDIMRAGIARTGPRVAELRERGFVIKNCLERAHDGRMLSRYWLCHDPERDGKQ